MKNSFIFTGLIAGFLIQPTLSAATLVNRYVSPSPPFVNSYWIESETGIVLIDAQMIKDDVDKLSALIKTTGKPLLAVFLTHPHFDHFGGLGHLKAEFANIDIYATEKTARAIETLYLEKGTRWKRFYGDKLAEYTPVNQIIKSDSAFSIAGMEFAVWHFGEGESEDHLLIEHKQSKSVFVGDMLFPFRHYWIAEGRPLKAIRQLKRLAKQYQDGEKFYPGHGEPTTTSSIPLQIQYIRFLLDKVGRQVTGAKHDLNLTVVDIEQIIDAVLEQYPAYVTGFSASRIIGKNIDGVLKYLARMNKDSE